MSNELFVFDLQAHKFPALCRQPLPYRIMEGLPVVWEPFAEEDVALSVGEARSAKCKWHGNPRRKRPFEGSVLATRKPMMSARKSAGLRSRVAGRSSHVASL